MLAEPPRTLRARTATPAQPMLRLRTNPTQLPLGTRLAALRTSHWTRSRRSTLGTVAGQAGGMGRRSGGSPQALLQAKAMTRCVFDYCTRLFPRVSFAESSKPLQTLHVPIASHEPPTESVRATPSATPVPERDAALNLGDAAEARTMQQPAPSAEPEIDVSAVEWMYKDPNGSEQGELTGDEVYGLFHNVLTRQVLLPARTCTFGTCTSTLRTTCQFAASKRRSTIPWLF